MHKKLLIISTFAVLTSLTSSALAQPIPTYARDFETRFSRNARGGIELVGNSLLTCEDEHELCAQAQVRDVIRNNGDLRMRYVDEDGMIDGDGDGADDTYASASATLEIPDGSTVVFAGLYWAAEYTEVTDLYTDASPFFSERENMLFRAPGGDYFEVDGTYEEAERAPPGFFFGLGFLDVTELVAAAGSGEYWGANIPAATGQVPWSGWAMIVVYENPDSPLRSLSVFDGFQIYADETLVVEVNDILTPQVGLVESEVGVVIFDGDARINPEDPADPALLQDGIFFGELPLSNDLNPLGDLANGTISRLGEPVAGRSPAYANTFGVDIDLFDATGGLDNGATSATLRWETGQDVLHTGVVTIATDIFFPFVETTKRFEDINGGDLEPGDQIRYFIEMTNSGEDASIDLRVTDMIPEFTSYVADSMRYEAGPGAPSDEALTDAAGDDVAEYDAGSDTVIVRVGADADSEMGGVLAKDESVLISFVVELDAAIPDGTEILNQANVSYGSLTPPSREYTGASDGDAEAVGDNPTVGTVSSGPRISISKEATLIDDADEDGKADIGDRIMWSLTVTNPRGWLATDYQVSDEIPDELTVDDVEVSDGGELISDEGDQNVIVRFASLEVGASETITITTTVAALPSPLAPIINQAIGSGEGLEDLLSDDPSLSGRTDPTGVLTSDCDALLLCGSANACADECACDPELACGEPGACDTDCSCDPLLVCGAPNACEAECACDPAALCGGVNACASACESSLVGVAGGACKCSAGSAGPSPSASLILLGLGLFVITRRRR